MLRKSVQWHGGAAKTRRQNNQNANAKAAAKIAFAKRQHIQSEMEQAQNKPGIFNFGKKYNEK